MSIERESRWREAGTQTIAPLSDETRRQVIRVLHENPGAISIQALAEQLTDSEDLDATDTDSLRVRLHHVHLPKLDDYGFVNWNRQEQTVSTTNRSVYEIAGTGEPTMNASAEVPARAFTDERLHEVLATVKSEQGPVTREALARQLARQEFDGQPTESRIEEIGVQLHHNHLPKLADADLVEYDVDDGTVEYLSPVESTAGLS